MRNTDDAGISDTQRYDYAMSLLSDETLTDYELANIVDQFSDFYDIVVESFTHPNAGKLTLYVAVDRLGLEHVLSDALYSGIAEMFMPMSELQYLLEFPPEWLTMMELAEVARIVTGDPASLLYHADENVVEKFSSQYLFLAGIDELFEFLKLAKGLNINDPDGVFFTGVNKTVQHRTLFAVFSEIVSSRDSSLKGLTDEQVDILFWFGSETDDQRLKALALKAVTANGGDFAKFLSPYIPYSPDFSVFFSNIFISSNASLADFLWKNSLKPSVMRLNSGEKLSEDEKRYCISLIGYLISSLRHDELFGKYLLSEFNALYKLRGGLKDFITEVFSILSESKFNFVENDSSVLEVLESHVTDYETCDRFLVALGLVGQTGVSVSQIGPETFKHVLRFAQPSSMAQCLANSTSTAPQAEMIVYLEKNMPEVGEPADMHSTSETEHYGDLCAEIMRDRSNSVELIHSAVSKAATLPCSDLVRSAVGEKRFREIVDLISEKLGLAEGLPYFYREQVVFLG